MLHYIYSFSVHFLSKSGFVDAGVLSDCNKQLSEFVVESVEELQGITHAHSEELRELQSTGSWYLSVSVPGEVR